LVELIFFCRNKMKTLTISFVDENRFKAWFLYNLIRLVSELHVRKKQ
jgi:hypothetical protein